MSWPVTVLLTISDTISGVSTAPLCVALVPTTPWMNRGMNRTVPNMPIAVSATAAIEVAMSVSSKRVSGIIGSAARDSSHTKAPPMRAPNASMPTISGDSQA